MFQDFTASQLKTVTRGLALVILAEVGEGTLAEASNKSSYRTAKRLFDAAVKNAENRKRLSEPSKPEEPKALTQAELAQLREVQQDKFPKELEELYQKGLGKEAGPGSQRWEIEKYL